MAEGRRITWIGKVPSITPQMFNDFGAALTAQFGATLIGTPTYQVSGGVVVASALYTKILAQALIKIEPAGTTLYLNLLWDGVPDMAGLKTLVQTTFAYQAATILEDTVTL